MKVCLKSYPSKSTTLLELLVVLAIITVLAALLLPAILRGMQTAKAWIYGSYAFHSFRLSVALEDNNDVLFQQLSTSKVEKWIFIKSPLSN